MKVDLASLTRLFFRLPVGLAIIFIALIVFNSHMLQSANHISDEWLSEIISKNAIPITYEYERPDKQTVVIFPKSPYLDLLNSSKPEVSIIAPRMGSFP